LANEVLFRPLINEIKRHILCFSNIEERVVPAQLQDKSVLIGAAYSVWHRLGRKAM